MTISNARTIGVSSLVAVLLYASGFLVLLTPLPLIYGYMRWGRRTGAVASFISLLLVGALYVVLLPLLPTPHAEQAWPTISLPGVALVQVFSLGSVQIFGVAYFVFFVVLAAAIGEGAQRNWSFNRWSGVSILAGCACIMLFASVAQLTSHASVIGSLRGYLDTVMADIIALNDQSGMSVAQMQYVASNKDGIISLVLALMPALVFVFVLTVVVLNILVGRRLVRTPRAIGRMRQAISFRLPESWVWVVIASGVCFFADYYVLHTGWLKVIAVNGLVAMGAVYFLQGFAVAAFFIERIRMRFARLLFYITIVIFFQTIGLLLVGVGIADVWIHFRQRLRTPAGIKG